MSTRSDDLLRFSARIVTAHAGHQAVSAEELPRIIREVYGTLEALAAEDRIGTPRPSPEARHEHRHHDHGHHHDDGHDHHAHAHHAPAPAIPADTAGSGRSAHAKLDPRHHQTVFPDRLICLEDGESMKTLKRHLRTVHGMTPEDYRAKWGLPDDYPMVAPDYARLRADLAKQGLRDKPRGRYGKPRQG